MKGDLEVVRFLIVKGADVNAKDDEDHTPLHWSAREGHLEVVQALIKSGSNFDGLSREDVVDLLRRIV